MLYVCNMVRHPLKNNFSIIRILFLMLSNFELYNNIIQIRLLLHVRTMHNAVRHQWRAQTRDVRGGTSHHTHTYTHTTHTHAHTHAYVWGNAVGARADNAELVRVHIRRRTQGRWPWDTTSIGPGECFIIILYYPMCVRIIIIKCIQPQWRRRRFSGKRWRRRPNSRWGRWCEM